ncbi:peptide ABC transporter substrate-binding protein [Clostridiales bacterium COT073_COT-073]|nr:peptide ABC transporter substrate-binding protein [Clostridiales bacterium COT073_COT-073]
MKKVLSLLMAFILVLSVAACTPTKKDEEKKTDEKQVTEKEAEKKEEEKKDEPKKEEEAKPEVKKIINLIETSNIPSLVTWLATDSVSFRVLGNINSGLFTNDTNGVPVEDLVDKYEVSADGLTYTFHLKDAKWVTVDGQEYAPVTANDFVFTVKKLLDPKEASQYAFMVATAGIKNGEAAVALSEGIVEHETNVKNLADMKLSDFKDNEKETAQAQFDAAKAKLEEAVKKGEADFADKYGSLEKAHEEVQKLIDGIGVTAVDEKTVKYELANPVPYFTALMTFPSFFPANQKFVEEKGDKYGSSVDNFLYNGAYIFKDWKVSQRHYLEKNPMYWDAANTQNDGIDFRVIEGVDNDTVVNMYLGGQLHSAGLSGENVEKYGNRPDVVTSEDTTLFYIEMNQGKGEPTSNKALLANVKARKALNMAFDKDYVTKTILANGSLTADYLVPVGLHSSHEFGDKDFREVAGDLFNGKEGYNKYNVEEAKKLWAEAKKETGVDKVQLELIIFQGESSSNIGTHLKNEWEKNLEGLTIVLKPLPFSEKIARGNRGEFELNFAGWGPDYPDAMTFVDLYVTGGGHNNLGYSNKDYDAVIASAKSGELTAPDKVKDRFEALVKAEKTLLEDDQVILPLYQRASTGLRDPKITGWKLQTFGADYIFKWVGLED